MAMTKEETRRTMEQLRASIRLSREMMPCRSRGTCALQPYQEKVARSLENSDQSCDQADTSVQP